MVVDFHIHPIHFDSLAPGYEAYLAAKVGPDWRALEGRYGRPGPFLGLLTENDVDYAVILAENTPVVTGVVSHEFVAEFCRASPRLFPFANINPHLTPRPARELERLVRDEGFRGLKLLPTYQFFYPNDAAIYPIYATAEELQIPVLIHTGSSVFPGARIKYGDPLFLDDVAVDFPGLAIVQAHGGRPFWYDRAAFLARLHPNVYVELAGLPPKRLLTYYPDLERIADKVIFGSDWPSIPDIRKNVEAIRQLPLSDGAKEQILGGNAARILRIG